MGIKFVVLLSNCRIRLYLLIFKKFCQGKENQTGKGRGMFIHGRVIYTGLLHFKPFFLQNKILNLNLKYKKL